MEKLLIEICNPKQWKTISTNNLLSEGYTVYGANGVIGYYNQYTHENPTLMITCRGATCGTLNISEPFSYINGNAMALDNLTDDVHIKYLYYYLMNRGFNDVISGSAQPQITRIGLSKIKVNYPNIEIQNKIVEVLDKAQELIDKRKEQIEALDELVKSRFVEMFGDPINNTKKFDMKKIKEISIYLKRGVSPKYVEQSNIKVINQKCIYWRNLKVENCKYYDENLKEKIEDIFLKQNDILINSTGTGTLGRCVKFNKIDNSEYIADSHVTVLRSISNNLNSDYFAALFEFTNIQDTIYRKCVNGSTNQIELSVSKLGEYLIMVPPIEFQNQFSEFVKQVDKLKLKIETNLKELEDNFNSLMQKAFKGELFN
ncbi:TPA: restriction endonuclease subunit S [Clostridioides difficile]|uniref:restriction endonuclease subunit S n=1 Tax=Clostridioides difficile TaxID=1496 RepID=UPI00038D16C7|nr:restriction endonuclease subunit S [Clostridioides difficile]EQK02319.1 type I restriction modification DNA specificity domain protein [Clostridioides difficile P59]MBG0191893.1 restriction endonuclease subunit S [Clostridioides difficile]MBH7223492.1 restriction endonuclease subunit S [Clostridioides difficile]MBY1574711.1 restriction endonuclease subunit S [Clostridioides difficile]MBZ0757382.1 restriction endonuclease subunit S [Clostridioides difficile]